MHTLLTRAGIAGPYVLGGWSIGGFDVRYYTLRYPQDTAGLILVDATEGWIATPPWIPSHRPSRRCTHGQPELDADDEVFWLGEQKRVTRKSSNAWLVRARFSGHAIATDQPRLVIEAIKQVVAAARRGAALPACGASPIAKPS